MHDLDDSRYLHCFKIPFTLTTHSYIEQFIDLSIACFRVFVKKQIVQHVLRTQGDQNMKKKRKTPPD